MRSTPPVADRHERSDRPRTGAPARSVNAGLPIARIDDERLTVRAVGPFRRDDVDAVSRRLDQLVSTGTGSLRIDCSGITEMDRAVVEVLRRVARRLESTGRVLELTNAAPRTRALLDGRPLTGAPNGHVTHCCAPAPGPTSDAPDTTLVTFEAPAWTGCVHAELLAEFVAWAPLAMDRREDGRFTLPVRLDAGREFRYRFLFDGELLVNDPAAADYAELDDGSWISVVRT